MFGDVGFNPTDNCWKVLVQPFITAATRTYPLAVPTLTSILSMEELPVQSVGNDHI